MYSTTPLALVPPFGWVSLSYYFFFYAASLTYTLYLCKFLRVLEKNTFRFIFILLTSPVLLITMFTTCFNSFLLTLITLVSKTLTLLSAITCGEQVQHPIPDCLADTYVNILDLFLTINYSTYFLKQFSPLVSPDHNLIPVSPLMSYCSSAAFGTPSLFRRSSAGHVALLNGTTLGGTDLTFHGLNIASVP